MKTREEYRQFQLEKLIDNSNLEELSRPISTINNLQQKDNTWIVCYYENNTNKLQIARIKNIEEWYFERLVFPKQRLFFEALPKAVLEIYTGEMAGALIADKISCDHLRVNTVYGSYSS